LAENSKTFRLPTYLHERLIAIRGAKYALEDQGIAPTVEVYSKQHFCFPITSLHFLCKHSSCDDFDNLSLSSSEHSRVTQYIGKESKQCYRGKSSLILPGVTSTGKCLLNLCYCKKSWF
jgi:hypothetical protein